MKVNKFSTNGAGFHQLELIAENAVEVAIINSMILYKSKIEAFVNTDTGKEKEFATIVINFDENNKHP